MKSSRVLGTAFALAASGLAGAHEGAHLAAHSHPHLGGEHLFMALIAVAAAAAVGYAVRRTGD
jgi:hypothetical protein